MFNVANSYSTVVRLTYSNVIFTVFWCLNKAKTFEPHLKSEAYSVLRMDAQNLKIAIGKALIAKIEARKANALATHAV